MKLFNINDHIAIQITEAGWNHLENTVGSSYVHHNVKKTEEIINNEVWHVLQAH